MLLSSLCAQNAKLWLFLLPVYPKELRAGKLSMAQRFDICGLALSCPRLFLTLEPSNTLNGSKCLDWAGARKAVQIIDPFQSFLDLAYLHSTHISNPILSGKMKCNLNYLSRN